MVFSLILAVATLLAPVTAGPVVFGYYPDWVQWGTYGMPPASIRYDRLTHLACAFAYPDSNGDLQAHIPEYYTLLPELVDSAAPHGVKVLASLGGATLSAGFGPTCTDSARLEKFVDQLVDHVTGYGLDGVDFDWEWPGNTAEEAGYTSLVRRVRERFDQVDPELITTLAGAYWDDWSGKYIAIDSLKGYLDHFNVMTYNYADPSWSAVAGHNAPLYGTGHSIDRTVSRYRALGVAPSQIVIGIPFYAKTYAGCTTLDGTFTGPGVPGPNAAYYQVDSLLSGSSYTRHWDAAAFCPYLTGEGQLISYDDSVSVTEKVRYALDSALAGVMIWQIQKGRLPDGTEKGYQPLLEAIWQASYPDRVADRPLPVPEISPLVCFPHPAGRNAGWQAPAGTGMITIHRLDGGTVDRLITNRQGSVSRARWSRTAGYMSDGMYLVVYEGRRLQVTAKMVFIR